MVAPDTVVVFLLLLGLEIMESLFLCHSSPTHAPFCDAFMTMWCVVRHIHALRLWVDSHSLETWKSMDMVFACCGFSISGFLVSQAMDVA